MNDLKNLFQTNNIYVIIKSRLININYILLKICTYYFTFD